MIMILETRIFIKKNRRKINEGENDKMLSNPQEPTSYSEKKIDGWVVQQSDKPMFIASDVESNKNIGVKAIFFQRASPLHLMKR